mgnify:CR=1 FL=1
MEIGDIIARMRRDLGIPQKILAYKLGLSTSYVCDLEQNRRPFPPTRVADLPEPIRSAVAKAMIEDRFAEIDRLRDMVADDIPQQRGVALDEALFRALPEAER